MSLDQLEADLAAMTIGHDPDRWAVTAYRVALARSESTASADVIDGALQLLGRAAGILSATRAPIEHARILTASANCHRRLADPKRAADLFEEAAVLMNGRSSPAEQAAALTNLGLAQIESGQPETALEPLDRAVRLTEGDLDDDEGRRVRGAALLNRAQAHQAAGNPGSLTRAADDYRLAVDGFGAESPQRGMALHGLGTTLLELARLDGDSTGVDDAVDVFRSSLQILTIDAFPFQHALAQHSLAIAYERRDRPLDSTRALVCAETSLAIFDPRLHRPQRDIAVATLARLEAGLQTGVATTSRVEHVVALLIATDEHERSTMLRDRLRRLSVLPLERTRRDLAGLAVSLVGLAVDDYDLVVRSMIPVLMELPEPVLDTACAELCGAHRRSDRPLAFDAALDEAVHDLLHGPQRVRVRDMLASYGWERP